MGVDILDLVFRLERSFHVRISREQFFRMLDTNEPPDIKVGELFDFMCRKASLAGIIDDELDAEAAWLIFQQALSDSLGVDSCDVTKDKWLLQELAAR
jgi:hypothetical protein